MPPASARPSLKVVRTLEELHELFNQADEPQWATLMRRFATQFQTAAPAELPGLARQVLGLFGGMASFSDLVLQEQNERLEALRRRLHVELVDLLTAQRSST